MITYAIKAELALHLLLLIDRLPLLCLTLGLASHVASSRLLRRFPYMELTSSEGLLSLAAFAASNLAWVRHFWTSMYTVEYIVAFLLVTTWLVPFGFFLGMAGDQSVLPGAGGYPYSAPQMGGSSSSGGGGEGGKRRRGLALRIFDILRRKRDEVMPDMMARMPASSGLMPKEKI